MIETAGPDLGLIFLLGWIAGLGFLLFGGWMLLYSMREGLNKYLLTQDDATKRDVMDRLGKIENELNYLEKKTNTKYCRWRHNGFTDLLAYLNKRKL